MEEAPRCSPKGMGHRHSNDSDFSTLFSLISPDRHSASGPSLVAGPSILFFPLVGEGLLAIR
ncbi:hypothetical protein [Nonomuraea dietziae]|uniref:hypothetical protein n=1 Tax=Nonomuraea dietziae TaxID=65515 RepID=UPI0031CE8DCF